MATFERVGRTSHKGGFASGLRMQVASSALGRDGF
jgi:hypothetical protein